MISLTYLSSVFSSDPMIRAAIYYRKPPSHHSSGVDLGWDLQQAVEDRGGVVVATYIDDEGATTRTRNAHWKALLANLDAIDQVIIASAGDLPAKSVKSLLKVLGTLRDNSVGLYLHREGIDTSCGSVFTVLDIGDALQARQTVAGHSNRASTIRGGW